MSSFAGRILSEGRKFDNTKTIYCEGSLAYLVDSVQKAEAFEGTTHELFRKIIANHNAQVEPEKRFVIGEITIEDRPIIISGQSDIITDTKPTLLTINRSLSMRPQTSGLQPTTIFPIA